VTLFCVAGVFSQMAKVKKREQGEKKGKKARFSVQKKAAPPKTSDEKA